MPAPYTGQLNSNEVLASLFNMIISIEVDSANIAGTFSSLVDEARVDGGLYGDTKLFVATDILESHPWVGDNEATNLLAIDRPPEPKEQAITLDVFRQVRVTIDNYLSKRAWQDEGTFAVFNGVILGWLRDTKRVYDSTTYNAFVGTYAYTQGTNGSTTLEIPEAKTEADRRNRSGIIGEALANIFIGLKDATRQYNDYNFMRSYDLNDIIVVWNSKWVNQIEKRDLPTIFHDERFKDLFDSKYVLPAKYFGAVSSATTVPSVGTYRSLIEQKITVGAVTKDYFAGEIVPAGATVPADSTYVEDGSVVCVVMHRRAIPFMSAFEIGTSFFNARSLTENHYLTWGHNTIEHLKDKPYFYIDVEDDSTLNEVISTKEVA